jgi:HK97 family phage prohead protease
MNRNQALARLNRLEAILYLDQLEARLLQERDELRRGAAIAAKRASRSSSDSRHYWARMNVPAQLFRSAQFERSAINKEQRTVALSASSNAPYERRFGMEILSHKPEHVRLGRLQKAGPLLFNHNRDQHIGRVISAGVDGTKLNAVVKFGSSPLAQEKFQDVVDGILTDTSIGYQIHKMVENADKKSFTATDWEPYEISLVTVPADATVGLGKETDVPLLRSY